MKNIIIVVLILSGCLSGVINQKLIKSSYLQGRYDENATMIEWQKRNMMTKELLEHRKKLLEGSAVLDGIKLNNDGGNK